MATSWTPANVSELDATVAAPLAAGTPLEFDLIVNSANDCIFDPAAGSFNLVRVKIGRKGERKVQISILQTAPGSIQGVWLNRTVNYNVIDKNNNRHLEISVVNTAGGGAVQEEWEIEAEKVYLPNTTVTAYGIDLKSAGSALTRFEPQFP